MSRDQNTISKPAIEEVSVYRRKIGYISIQDPCIDFVLSTEFDAEADPIGIDELSIEDTQIRALRLYQHVFRLTHRDFNTYAEAMDWLSSLEEYPNDVILGTIDLSAMDPQDVPSWRVMYDCLLAYVMRLNHVPEDQARVAQCINGLVALNINLSYFGFLPQSDRSTLDLLLSREDLLMGKNTEAGQEKPVAELQKFEPLPHSIWAQEEMK